jgi:two-component system, chemotaxis family, sensor kinase CheA
MNGSSKLLKGKRIFIVEDDLENRIIAQILLAEQGAEVVFERGGRQTCEKLKLFAPVDIILLDLMFPGNVSGFDIYDQIRLMPEFSTIPIVAVSASDTSAAVPKARTKGFAGFITKPVSFGNFARQVFEILNGQPVWQSR